MDHPGVHFHNHHHHHHHHNHHLAHCIGDPVPTLIFFSHIEALVLTHWCSGDLAEGGDGYRDDDGPGEDDDGPGKDDDGPGEDGDDPGKDGDGPGKVMMVLVKMIMVLIITTWSRTRLHPGPLVTRGSLCLLSITSGQSLFKRSGRSLELPIKTHI